MDAITVLRKSLKDVAGYKNIGLTKSLRLLVLRQGLSLVPCSSARRPRDSPAEPPAEEGEGGLRAGAIEPGVQDPGGQMAVPRDQDRVSFVLHSFLGVLRPN